MIAEFRNIFDVLDVSYELDWEEDGDPNELYWWSRLPDRSSIRYILLRIKDMVEHKYFERAMDFVIFTNTVYIIVQAGREHPQTSTDPKVHRTDVVQWLFFMFYVVGTCTRQPHLYTQVHSHCSRSSVTFLPANSHVP